MVVRIEAAADGTANPVCGAISGPKLPSAVEIPIIAVVAPGVSFPTHKSVPLSRGRSKPDT